MTAQNPDTHTLHITGSLHPTENTVTPKTYRNLYTAVAKHRLYGIVSSDGWKNGVINIDHANINNPKDGSQSAPLASPMDFIERLTRFVASHEISDLNLAGEITVTVPGPNPTVFRLHVQNATVRYQQATLIWDETTLTF